MVGKNVLEHPAIKSYEMVTPLRKELNLLDYAAVERFIREHKPDMVIHAAGTVGGIQANMKEPVRFLMDNLDMGRNIVWASRQIGIRKLINLGSSCMYPRNALNPLPEDAILQGELEPTNEGYALAKITIARLCQYISRENPDYQYKTLIPCNLYGRWDRFDLFSGHMIPAVIMKIHEAKERDYNHVEMWGDGTARREFMFAGDFADSLVHAIHHFDSMPSIMNVGTGRDFSIDEYYRAIASAIGYKGSFTHDLSKPVGMKQKMVKIDLLNAWGWRARTSLKEGLTATYQFYLDQTKQI